MDMFDDSSAEIWVRTFQGLEDYIYPVDFLLAQNGSKYKAIIHYKSSQDKLYYEGEYTKDNEIQLAEFSLDGYQTGKINLSLKKRSCTGTLTDGSSDVALVLVEDRVNNIETPKAANYHGVKVYAGNKAGKDILLNVIKKKAKVIVWMTGMNDYVEASNIDILHHKYQLSDVKIGDVSNRDLYIEEKENTLIAFYNNIKTDSVELSLVEELSYDIDTWASFYTKYNECLPAIESKNMVKWCTSQKVKVAQILVEAKLEDVTGSYIQNQKEVRMLGVDCSVRYLDVDFISGDILTYSPDGMWIDSFIYLRKKDKFLELKDIVHIKKLLTAFDKLDKTYDQVELVTGGIQLSTTYDVLAGKKSLVISYDDIAAIDKTIIKHKSLRKNFL